MRGDRYPLAVRKLIWKDVVRRELHKAMSKLYRQIQQLQGEIDEIDLRIYEEWKAKRAKEPKP